MIVEGPLLVSGFPPRAQGTRGQSLAMMASTSSSVKVASEIPPPPIYHYQIPMHENSMIYS